MEAIASRVEAIALRVEWRPSLLSFCKNLLKHFASVFSTRVPLFRESPWRPKSTEPSLFAFVSIGLRGLNVSKIKENKD